MHKICHITTVHPRYDGRIFRKECVSLAKEPLYDVTLIVNDMNEDEVLDGVNILSLRHNAGGRIKRMLFSSRKALEKALSVNAEVYHIHDPELLPLALKLKKKGFRVIFDSHEFTYYQIPLKSYIPKPVLGLVAKVYGSYERHVLSRIDAVIVPCTYDGRNYFESFAKRTVFIDNLPYLIEPSKEDNSKDFSLCYVGSLTRARGAEIMLDAAVATNTKLVFAGAFEEDLYNQVRAQLESDVLSYKGFVGKDEVQELLSSASVGLSLLQNTGQYEHLDNLPTKVYEYFMFGLPVILSRRSFSEKFVEENPVAILVDPGNLDEICSAINEFKNNPNLVDEMGARARRIAEDSYCWEKESLKLLSLYADLLES
ncbi:MAG: glycosyltransferase [Mogibacterium sp.]|nr:glycosyltransferase [Mogibacterium sp.]